MNEIIKEYSNGQLTVVWKPAICIHSKICWDKLNGLPQVFNPMEKPWVKMEAASTDEIIAQIERCPSGALSCYMNAEKAKQDENTNGTCIVEVTPAGPLLVHGSIIVKDGKGSELKRRKLTAFCRCGASANKPYCDGSHQKLDFKD